tara:strand:- start:842 stop:1300 length:459 start_codon:yes stop_codon:yes gene_type:complete
MKKLVTVLAIGLLLTSCISYKYGSSVVLNGKRTAPAGLSYRSSKYLTSINSASKNLKGGLVVVHVSGATIDFANTENWTCVVYGKNGKEIDREEGSFGLPELPSQSNGNRWTNSFALSLDTNIVDYFNVKVINNISNGIASFKVYPNQKVNK